VGMAILDVVADTMVGDTAGVAGMIGVANLAV